MNYLENLNAGFESFDKATEIRKQIMSEIGLFSKAVEDFTISKFNVKICVRLEKHFDKRYKGVARAAVLANSWLGDEVEKYQKTYLALYCDSVGKSELLSEISISDEGFPIVIAAFGMQSIITELTELQQGLVSFTNKFEFMESIKNLVETYNSSSGGANIE